MCLHCFMIFFNAIPKMDQTFSLKRVSKVAVAALLVLFAGAMVFWRQRTLFVDDAFIPSLIFNSHKLQIQENRFGSFITQMVPLIGSKLHLPVKAILIGYSISFNLFYFCVITLLTYRFRQYALAILMGLYYAIFVSDAFFWTNNEVHQGIAWMFLCLGFVLRLHEQNAASWKMYLTILLLGGLAIFTHPLIGIILLFLWVFLWLRKKEWSFTTKQSVVITILLVLLFAARYTASQCSGWYDADKMHNVTHLTLPQVFHTFKSAVADSFFSDCKTNYWWIFIIIATGLWAMLKEQKKLLTVYVIVGSVVYFILISLTYDGAYDKHTRFYMESEWQPFTIFLSVGFVYYFLPRLNEKRAALLLAVIFVTRFCYIIHSSALFTSRIDFISKGLVQMQQKGLMKVVIATKDSKMEDTLLMSWGLPVESMMLSAMRGENPQRTMITIPETELQNRYTNSKDTMMFPFALRGLHQLNPHYFKLDTTQQYKVMSMNELWD